MIHEDKYPERSQVHNGYPFDQPLFSGKEGKGSGQGHVVKVSALTGAGHPEGAQNTPADGDRVSSQSPKPMDSQSVQSLSHVRLFASP